jgi:hypothetical protein
MSLLTLPNAITHAASNAIGVLAPLYTRKYIREFTIGSNKYRLTIPQSLATDPADLVAEVTTTAITGTGAITMVITPQESGDPWNNYTQINMPTANGISASATTLIVDSAANIPNAVTQILLVSFEEIFPNLYVPSKMEMVQSTSKSSNTLTIDRAIYDDTNTAFSDNDFVFWGTQWTTLFDSAGNSTAKTITLTGAAASTPVTGSNSLSEEGLDGLKSAFFRLSCAAPSAGTAAYTGRYKVRER